jgi:hypothetical protein
MKQMGARERADVNKALYAMGQKKADECSHGMGGMADGENKSHSLNTPLQSG